jgi:hypothetical protein
MMSPLVRLVETDRCPDVNALPVCLAVDSPEKFDGWGEHFPYGKVYISIVILKARMHAPRRIVEHKPKNRKPPCS